MIIGLILGLIIGGFAVLFALENIGVVTVSVMSLQLTAPLALILLTCMAVGAIITLLALLPSLVHDEMYLKTIKRQKAEIEEEFAKYRTATLLSTAPQIVEQHRVIA